MFFSFIPKLFELLLPDLSGSGSMLRKGCTVCKGTVKDRFLSRLLKCFYA